MCTVSPVIAAAIVFGIIFTFIALRLLKDVIRQMDNDDRQKKMRGELILQELRQKLLDTYLTRRLENASENSLEDYLEGQPDLLEGGQVPTASDQQTIDIENSSTADPTLEEISL